MGMFDDAWRESVKKTSSIGYALSSDVEIWKQDMKNLTEAHYNSLKRIKELKEQNIELEKELKKIKETLIKVNDMLEEIRKEYLQ